MKTTAFDTYLIAKVEFTPGICGELESLEESATFRQRLTHLASAASGNFDELVQSVRMLPKGQRPTDSFILDVIDKHLRAKFGDRA